MQSGNANIIVEFILEHWQVFVNHCKRYDLDEDVANEILDDLNRDAGTD